MGKPSVTKSAASDAAATLGRRSWQQLKRTLSDAELTKRQSDAGKLGGRPPKDR